MVKNWLETQDCSRFAFLKDKDENVTGVQIGLGKRMCLHYYNTGSHHTTKGCCSKWHICKRFLEGDCSRGCGRSHDFHDDHNRENTKGFGLQNFLNKLIRRLVGYSLPQVCIRYLEGKCKSHECPYFHICASVVQQTPCGCSLSHNFVHSYEHSKMVLERYRRSHLIFIKNQGDINVLLCNILVPLEQKIVNSILKHRRWCK